MSYIVINEISQTIESELLTKARSMEKLSDPKSLDEPVAKYVKLSEQYTFNLSEVCTEKLEPNSKYEIDGDIYETDDNGNIYKKNGELMPDTTYERNGIIYTTDKNGRIISWSGDSQYDPENGRDNKSQKEAGGEDRKEGDDGGHLVARELGGASGNENVVAMRDTVNRGDYKKTENEIAEAKKQKKDVQDSGRVIYDGESSRPSKIERTYTIDGVKKELTVDNVEGSQDLLEKVEGEISEDDYNNIKDEIADREEDGHEVSVTSVLKEYDKDGNLVSVRVCITDETTGEKYYSTYSAKGGN